MEKKDSPNQDVYTKNKKARINLRERKMKMGVLSRPTHRVRREKASTNTTTLTNKHVDFVDQGATPQGKTNVSNTMVLTAYNKKVSYFDLKTYKKWFEMEVEEPLYTFENLSPEHPFIVVLGGSPSLMIYHLRDKVLVGGKYTKHSKDSKVYCLKYIPSRDFVISGSSSGELILWKFHKDNHLLSFCSLVRPSNEGKHINNILRLNDEKQTILVANNSRNLTLFSLDFLEKKELFQNYKDFLYSKNKVHLRNGHERDLIINDLQEETIGLANYDMAKKNIAFNK